MSNTFILDGHKVVPTDLDTWSRWFQRANRKVASDHIGDILISTVFLGLDHSYGSGPPLLFETMIFGGPHDQYQERYTTWEEAEAGHAKALEIVKEQKEVIE